MPHSLFFQIMFVELNTEIMLPVVVLSEPSLPHKE